MRKDIHAQNIKNDNEMYIYGTCQHKDMEKEADFYINPEVDITLQLPVLNERFKKCRAKLKEEFHKRVRNTYDEGKKYLDSYAYLIQRLYDLEDISQLELKPKNFIDYVKKRIDRRTKDGFPIPKKSNPTRYIINCIAAIEVVRQTKIADIPCTCKKKKMLKQILPVGINTGKVMCYTSCMKTLFAAFKRQLKAVPQPDKKILQEFLDFSKKLIDKYIIPHLDDFDYSLSKWMNHLSAAKQDKMDMAKMNYERKFDEKGKKIILDKVIYGLMCKIEAQQAGGKNRAIANIKDDIKYIMGPVCWELEQLFTKYFPGYCGNKSGTDLEDYLSSAYENGFNVSMQGDGSGFDLSQHPEIRELDKYIYNKLIERHKIWHVDEKDFKFVTNVDCRQILPEIIVNNRKMVPFTSIIPGTVFSGSSDTTLMNTIRMACYNHFTLYKAKMEMNEYELLAKGDDFMVLTDASSTGKIKKSYEELWSAKPKDKSYESNYKRKGLGQILKFIKIGDFSTIDFCSNAIIQYNYDGKVRFRVMRRPERMIELAHYSRKATHMNDKELKQYYTDMALALRVTAGYVPFYRNYIDAFEFYASLIKPEHCKGRHNDPKKKKWYSPDEHQKNTIQVGHSEEKQIAGMFDKYNMKISVLQRVSKYQKLINDEDIYAFLLNTYGLTKDMIQQHREHLMNPSMMYDIISDFILKD
jgi:hypothetical protein